MKDLWKSWNEVKKICQDKTVVFWGRSEDWIPKTVKKIEKCVDKIIIDRNPTYEGSFFRDLPIFLPSKIDSLNIDDIYIIITGGVYESIAEDLVNLGLYQERISAAPQRFEIGASYKKLENTIKIL
jgi:hypothetical protein